MTPEQWQKAMQHEAEQVEDAAWVAQTRQFARQRQLNRQWAAFVALLTVTFLVNEAFINAVMWLDRGGMPALRLPPTAVTLLSGFVPVLVGYIGARLGLRWPAQLGFMPVYFVLSMLLSEVVWIDRSFPPSGPAYGVHWPPSVPAVNWAELPLLLVPTALILFGAWLASRSPVSRRRQRA